MKREYQQHATDEVKQLLDQLIDMSCPPEKYAQTLEQLGYLLGPIIAEYAGKEDQLALACTVEDADYLAKGIIKYLEEKRGHVYVAVFWNKRIKTGGISVAPIIKEFRETNITESKILVVVKSIISSSCVVGTNLTRLIEDFQPEQIFVAAPVLWKNSIENLRNEFDAAISDRFKYIYFAADEERQPDGTVVPGIGGDIYQRLGFKDQNQKNKFVPELVKERRNVI